MSKNVQSSISQFQEFFEVLGLTESVLFSA